MSANQSAYSYEVGNRVALRANPRRAGMIKDRRTSPTGAEYLVFFGPNEEAWYSESLLETRTGVKDVQVIGRNQFIRNLAIEKIRGGFSDVLYSYTASRTEIEPYQFRPAAKFLESSSHRLLIADEVGLGKTIEAGIIFLEMKARTRLDRFLVVCPSRLREKWQSEFRDRFGETLDNLDRPRFEQFLREFKRFGDATRLSGVIAIETIRDAQFSEQLAELGVSFDLVVIDEAHHFRNPQTMTHRSGQALSDAAAAMLLLSATPINLGNQDLYNLLKILDEGQFPDMYTFEQMLQPAQALNEAMRLLGAEPSAQHQFFNALARLPITPVGREVSRQPDYDMLKRELAEGKVLDRNGIVTIKHRLAALSPLSTTISRTKKSEVAAGALRDPHVLLVTLTEAVHDFYDLILRYVTLQHSYSQRGSNPGFQLVMKERQAASCLPATNQALFSGFLVEYEGADTELEEEDVSSVPANDQLRDLERQLRSLGNAIGDTDTKMEVFLRALRVIYDDNPNGKVLVFSTFKRTLNYLRQQLLRRTSWIDGGVFLLTGDLAVADRPQVIERFRTATGFSVLLMSEVGAEGLDFQFTDVLFNYDLPWNPMRVEQRIGRIDRYGQQQPTVRLYSLILEGTIEERILARLYDRVGVFRQSIGELEPVLGDIERNITRSIFTSVLSNEQQIAIAERELDALEEEKQHQAQYEELERQLIGQDILLSQEPDSRIHKGRHLSEEELRILLESGLAQRYNRHGLSDKGDGYFFLQATPILREDIRRFCEEHKVPRDLEGGLLAGLSERGIPLTFRGDLAHRRPLAHLLNFRHPLIQFAASLIPDNQTGPRNLGVFRIDSEDWPSGLFSFFIYRLDITSMEPRSELTAVVLDSSLESYSELAEALLIDIPKSTTLIEQIPDVDTMVKDEEIYAIFANDEFARIRHNVQGTIQAANDARMGIQLTAIRKTYAAKLNRIREWSKTSNERIRRMRESQLENTAAERDRRIQEIEQHQQVAVGGNLLLQGIVVANY